MANTKTISKVLTVLLLLLQNSFAQTKGLDATKVKKTETDNSLNEKSNINGINGGMPNRISMNVTIARQTQGATFGEKVNAGKINVALIKGGCVVLFPLNTGYKVNTVDKTIVELTKEERLAFGEKVNQGLQTAAGALAQGASLLGGALPGGAIISAAVSGVGNLAGGAGGGAAAASYAKNKEMVWKMEGTDAETKLELSDGEYELAFVTVEKATSGLKDTLKTQVRIGFTVENGVLKTKHDTVKNSVGNIR
jgi:hypothetical protein